MRFRNGVPSTLEEFARAMMDGAKVNMRERGQVLPLVVLLPPSKRVAVAHITTVQKEFWPLFVSGMVQANGGKLFIAMIYEAWFKILDERERATARLPSTYDDREEVIIVEAKDSIGLTIAHIQPIERDDKARAVFKRPAYFLGTKEHPYQSRVLEFA